MNAVAQIQMPEGECFRARMPEDGNTEAFSLGDSALCELAYGQDIGRLMRIAPAAPGEDLPAFRVLRKQTADDAAQASANAELAQKARQAFQLAVRYEKTPVKVLHMRFSFNSERLFIRYSAAVAVDLRRFISQIQRDYKTTVDLWQVGVRDAAAFVGCVGVCGREACCCTWQRRFQNLSTRMAKVQDVPLSPVTANGRCGCLKCCMAFEYEQYCQAGKDLPGVGSLVRCLLETREEEAAVISRDVMRGRLTVRTREGHVLKLLKEDVLAVRVTMPDNTTKGEMHEDSVGEWSEP